MHCLSTVHRLKRVKIQKYSHRIPSSVFVNCSSILLHKSFFFFGILVWNEVIFFHSTLSQLCVVLLKHSTMSIFHSYTHVQSGRWYVFNSHSFPTLCQSSLTLCNKSFGCQPKYRTNGT